MRLDIYRYSPDMRPYFVREEKVATQRKAWSIAEKYQYAGYTVQIVNAAGKVLGTLIAK